MSDDLVKRLREKTVEVDNVLVQDPDCGAVYQQTLYGPDPDCVEAADLIEAQAALIAEAREALEKAKVALVDLGACDDPQCREECCVSALPSVRKTLAKLDNA